MKMLYWSEDDIRREIKYKDSEELWLILTPFKKVNQNEPITKEGFMPRIVSDGKKEYLIKGNMPIYNDAKILLEPLKDKLKLIDDLEGKISEIEKVYRDPMNYVFFPIYKGVINSIHFFYFLLFDISEKKVYRTNIKSLFCLEYNSGINVFSNSVINLHRRHRKILTINSWEEDYERITNKIKKEKEDIEKRLKRKELENIIQNSSIDGVYISIISTIKVLIEKNYITMNSDGKIRDKFEEIIKKEMSDKEIRFVSEDSIVNLGDKIYHKYLLTIHDEFILKRAKIIKRRVS